jgi:two-component system sensor histidine kinase KdpD
VLRREAGRWHVEVHAGDPPPASPGDGATVTLEADGLEDHVLVVGGRVLDPVDHEMLRIFASQVVVALQTSHLAGGAAAAASLSAVDAVRTALLRAVSHDLRTPLASIKAYVSGLRQPDVRWTPEDISEALEAIEQSCDELDHVIGNLLDASRLEAGALAVSCRPAALDEVVVRAVRGTEPSTVQVVVPETLPLVETDPALLERAIANVVLNACRYQPPGCPVVIDATVVRDAVHLRVVDRGPGIPQRDRSRVTQPFQRLGDQTTSDGIGLGLSITHGFLDAVHAQMELDDTPGGGLTVTIIVPVAAASRDHASHWAGVP